MLRCNCREIRIRWFFLSSKCSPCSISFPQLYIWRGSDCPPGRFQHFVVFHTFFLSLEKSQFPTGSFFYAKYAEFWNQVPKMIYEKIKSSCFYTISFRILFWIKFHTLYESIMRRCLSLW